MHVNVILCNRIQTPRFSGVILSILAVFLFGGCNYATNRLKDAMDPWMIGVEYRIPSFYFHASASLLGTGIGYLGEGPTWERDVVSSKNTPKGIGFLKRWGFGKYWSMGGGFIGLSGSTYGVDREMRKGDPSVIIAGPKGGFSQNWTPHEFLGNSSYLYFFHTILWKIVLPTEKEREGMESAPLRKQIMMAGNFEFVAVPMGGFRVGFNPLEFFDFFLGFATIDIAGDDEDAPPEPDKRGE